MNTNVLKKGYRNAWIITLGSLIFIVAATVFVMRMHLPEPEVTWDMGGKPFVPSSSQYGEGYHEPEGTQPWTQSQKRTRP